eukprot:Opistho-2@59024
MSVSVVTPVVVLSTGSVQQADLPSSFDENAKESKVLKIVQSNAHSNEESVMEVMDKYGWEENFMMNVGDVKGKIVDDVVGETLAKKVAGIDMLVFVELGCYCGYSAVRIGRLLRRWFESVANVNNATRPHFLLARNQSDICRRRPEDHNACGAGRICDDYSRCWRRLHH